MVIVTLAGKLLMAENEQLASEGRPEHAIVTAVEMVAFELTGTVVCPCCPPVIVRGAGAVTVSAVCVTVTPPSENEGASFAPSPLKHATTVWLPTPSCEPETPASEAVALQLVVQLLAGTRADVPSLLPLHEVPA